MWLAFAGSPGYQPSEGVGCAATTFANRAAPRFCASAGGLLAGPAMPCRHILSELLRHPTGNLRLPPGHRSSGTCWRLGGRLRLGWRAARLGGAHAFLVVMLAARSLHVSLHARAVPVMLTYAVVVSRGCSRVYLPARRSARRTRVR